MSWGPCAVDLSAEDPTTFRRAKIILHVSNNFHRKGVDFLVATAARVREVEPEARFVVIGRDASGLKVDNPGNVDFTGPIYERAVLESYFRRACLFFLTHRFYRSPHRPV